MFFSPLDCFLCSPGLYIKGQDWILILLLLFSFNTLLTPHRTLVSTHKINKYAKFGSILLGVSREDDENIVSHRVLITFWPSVAIRLDMMIQSGMHGRNINECRSNDCLSNECRRNNCRSNDCRRNETTPTKGQSRETGKIATFVSPIVHVCSIHLPHF